MNEDKFVTYLKCAYGGDEIPFFFKVSSKYLTTMGTSSLYYMPILIPGATYLRHCYLTTPWTFYFFIRNIHIPPSFCIVGHCIIEKSQLYYLEQNLLAITSTLLGIGKFQSA